MIVAKRYAVALMIVSVISFCSCVGDSQTSDVKVTNDCAITNVTLGTLKRVVTTKKSEGKDTTYLTTVYGGLYPMYIDQLSKEIYNADSLPLGTDVKSVVFSTFTSDGSVAYRTEAGSDTLYSSTDSIDFSSPRLFTCYSYSGKAKKTYTVRVNVRKTDPNLFVWSRLGAESELASLAGTNMLIKDGTLHLFGIQDGKSLLFTASTDSIVQWAKSDLTGDVPDNTSDVKLFGGKFWGVKDSCLVASDDGLFWESVNVEALPAVRSIVGASSAFLFVLCADGVYQSKSGIVWSKERLDDAYDKLPVAGMSFTVLGMDFNSSFDNLLWAGMTSSGNLSLWKKTSDRTSQTNDVWSYYPFTEEIKYPLPELKSPVMFTYDDRALYVGCLNDTLSAFYVSSDAGRNWIPAANVYVHPRGLSAERVACAVDDNNFLWLVCGGSGEVWRGRLNKLAVVKSQSAAE